MNIQDRIAKLEKELVELKESYMKDEDAKQDGWKPRVGEIVEMSDDSVGWILRRYSGKNSFDYIDEYGETFQFCRSLNDPMVIQLIPHVPGDPRPSFGDAHRIIIAFENGEYDVSYSHDVDWGNDLDDYNVIGWFDIT